ncbi:MAG: outer membrane protein assembly factor BamD [Candidatus Puniceispirillaceae bacterium]
MTSQKKFLMIAACCFMAGCSSGPEIVEQVEQPVEVLYRDAMTTAVSGDTKAAAPKFEEVERQHPYSSLAVRAQIMAAWSFYQANQYSRAISALDRFVELNPADPLVEYAYYLRALSHYEQIVDVERDAEMTKLALAAFEELVRRFPQGIYARDGQLKIDLTKSHLAGKEMAVGRFYLKRQQYTAAIRRFDIVIKTYDTTNQVPEALYRTAEAYYALGLSDQSERIFEVAAYNYPDSVWTERLASLRADPEKPGKKGVLERSVDVISDIFN